MTSTLLLPRTAAEMRSIEPQIRDEVRTVTLTDVRATTDDDGTIRAGGLAIVFDSPSVDMYGWYEVVKRGALRKLLATSPDVRLLVNHDGLPLARTINGTLRLRETPKGLEWEAEFAPTTLAADVAVLLERGDLSQMSFRFRVAKGGAVWVEDADDEGRERREVIEIAELPEISIVTFPAYEATTAGLRTAPGTHPSTDPAADSQPAPSGVEGDSRGTPDPGHPADEGAADIESAAANQRLCQARQRLAAISHPL